MADINAQFIDADGLTAVYTAASAGGDSLQLRSNGFAHFKNASAGAITVTVVTPGTVNGLAVADRTLSVPAGGDAFLALREADYRDPTTRRAAVTYTAAAGLSVAVLTI